MKKRNPVEKMKKIMFFFIIVILSAVFSFSLQESFGQSQFQRTIGGIGFEYGQTIIRSTNGGYIMAGRTSTFGGANYDFYIVKIDSNGLLQWSRTVGGTGVDYALSITRTTDGGYAVAGYTESFGAGNYDFYIVKIDSSGSLQWSKTIGGISTDQGLSITQTSDGGYALSGKTGTGVGNGDFYIVKLDSSGSLQWSKIIVNVNGDDEALSIIQTSDGGFAVAGHLSSGSSNFCIVKLDANGSLVWIKTVGGTSSDVAYSIIQTTEGGFAVAGWTDSFGSSRDAYIIKLDASGALQWNKTIGGAAVDEVNSIIQISDGSYIMAGRTSSFGAGNSDFYVVKLDVSGSLQWSKAIGGTNNEFAYSIIQATDGGYAVAGYTQSFGAGNTDFYIVKLDASGNSCGNSISPNSTVTTPAATVTILTPTVTTPTPSVITPAPNVNSGGTVNTNCLVGIQPVSNEIQSEFSLSQNYPNPFNPVTNFEFHIADFGFVTLEIFDALGRNIETLVDSQLKPGTYRVDWTAVNYPSGIYFYSLKTNSFSDTKKMVLVK